MHLVAAIWLLIVCGAQCYSGVAANDAAGATPLAAAGHTASNKTSATPTSRRTISDGTNSPEIDAVISSSEIVATGSIPSQIVESSGGGGGGGDKDTQSIGTISVQQQQPSSETTGGIITQKQNSANGSCHSDETQSPIPKLAADDYQQQQQQLQYSNSRLLLRFLVISLFILVSLSLFTVYAIKFCLCQRRAQPGAAGSQQRRRPKPATRNFLALNLRRCNLIADAAAAAAAPTPDQQEQNHHHHHHHHAHLLPPHGRSPPQDLHYGQPLDQRQTLAAAAAVAPLQCSCFHPDLIGGGGILDAGRQLTGQSRLAAAAEQCVWWCQAQHFGNSNQFCGQPQSPDQLLNCQQIVSLAHEPAASAAAVSEPCVQSEERTSSMLAAQAPPPAYSDIYSSSSGGELLTSSAARGFNSSTNSTTTTTTTLPQLADAAGSHQFQQSMAAPPLIDTHRQKSLLVKLNLNKTRVLSPEELMLLSRLIDVPIVVQQQQQQDSSQVGDLSARTAAAEVAAAAVTAAGAIDDEPLEEEDEQEETDDNRQESR